MNRPMIFFDLDDTLLDYTSAMRTAAGLFWAEHLDVFAEFSIDSFVSLWESLAIQFSRKALAGEISWAAQQQLRMQELFKRAGRSVGLARADELFGQFLQSFRANWRPFADVRSVLEKLAALPLGIISNGESAQQHGKLLAMRLADHFKPIVVSGDIGIHKPEPAIFRYACELAGRSPGDCIFVGDQLDGDARAATAAGMHGVWLNRSRLFVPGCDVETIESLSELPAVVAACRR